MAIITTEVLITPALAAEYLLRPRAPLTRIPYEKIVERFAAHMASGKWIVTPNPIVFGEDGSLIDGVQRLTAVVRSGVTIASLVVTGASTQSFGTLDVQENEE